MSAPLPLSLSLSVTHPSGSADDEARMLKITPQSPPHALSLSDRGDGPDGAAQGAAAAGLLRRGRRGCERRQWRHRVRVALHHHPRGASVGKAGLVQSIDCISMWAKCSIVFCHASPPKKQGPGPAKRSTPGTLAVAGADASSGLVPWHEDFVFEGVKASEQVTVTCFLHRRSLAASGAGGGDALGES